MIASPAASPSAAAAEPKPRAKPSSAHMNRWRTAGQERAYCRRLVGALRAAAAGRRLAGPRDVKEAADSALALSAHGRTRWSRAILLGRRRRRTRSRCCSKLLEKAGGGKGRHRSGRLRLAAQPPPPPGKGSRVRDRLRVLGRLVPGCRKLSAPSLLEETVDYVAALQVQVKAMRALASALAAVAAATAVATEGGSPESGRV